MEKMVLPNDGLKNLLVWVDVLSGFSGLEPVETLTSLAIKKALVSMLQKSVTSECPYYHPNKNCIDQGRDFEGENRKFCKNVGFHQYHTVSETKATSAKRSIRSLKADIIHYLEKHWTSRYNAKLQDFVQTAISRLNRWIGMTPVSVKKKHVMRLLASANQKQYSMTTTTTKPCYNVGDKVTIALHNMPIRKRYLQ